MSSSVEQIKSRLGVEEVVGSYLKLQRAGANLKANCPFHNEKTPSFFVSPSRESWHCFGCSKGGDIFNFVMEIEGVEFYDALKILAERAGVELEPVSTEYRSEKSRLTNLLLTAKTFYQLELKKNQGVIDYLKSRGIKGEAARDFGIGFAPGPVSDEQAGWRKLHDYLKLKGFSEVEMEKAGMIIKRGFSQTGTQINTDDISDNQRSNQQLSAHCYDRFRDRIMFPLVSSSGQVIGFSGRVFEAAPTLAEGEVGAPTPEGVGGKYVNSPQTVLFNKSNFLYGFDKAKVEIRKKDFCVLVEGQVDVIMSYQAGVKNTVGVSGTALTAEHLKTIKRLTDNLIVVLDRDEAGMNASKKSIDLIDKMAKVIALEDAASSGFNIKMAKLPDGQDPADVIKDNPEKWIETIEKAQHFIEFFIELISEKTKDSAVLRKEIEKNILPFVAMLASEMEKAHWVGKIAGLLKIKEEPVWEQLKKIKIEPKKKSVPQSSVLSQSHSRSDLLKEKIIGLALWQKSTEDEVLKKRIEEVLKINNWTLEGDEAYLKRLIFEAEIVCGGEKSLIDELNKMVFEFEKENLKKELENLSYKIKRAEGVEQEKEYLQKFGELSKRLNGLGSSQ